MTKEKKKIAIASGAAVFPGVLYGCPSLGPFRKIAA